MIEFVVLITPWCRPFLFSFFSTRGRYCNDTLLASPLRRRHSKGDVNTDICIIRKVPHLRGWGVFSDNKPSSPLPLSPMKPPQHQAYANRFPSTSAYRTLSTYSVYLFGAQQQHGIEFRRGIVRTPPPPPLVASGVLLSQINGVGAPVAEKVPSRPSNDTDVTLVLRTDT